MCACLCTCASICLKRSGEIRACIFYVGQARSATEVCMGVHKCACLRVHLNARVCMCVRIYGFCLNHERDLEHAYSASFSCMRSAHAYSASFSCTRSAMKRTPIAVNPIT